MNIEEIALKEYPVVIKPTGKTIDGGVYNEDINHERRKHFIKGLEYADKETERLKAELEAKDKEIKNAYSKGYNEGTTEAIKEMYKNYRPND